MTELATSSIPTLDELASDTLVHRFGDLFNPPGLTNFLGCVQVDNDLFAIRNLNFPPLATSDINTAALYVDRRHRGARAVEHAKAPVVVQRDDPVTFAVLALGGM